MGLKINFFKRFFLYFPSTIEKIIFTKKNFKVKKNTLLILRLDSIGDYVLFRNFIKEIKESEKYKNYEIILCGNSWWKLLSENLDIKYITKFIWVEYGKMNEVSYRCSIYRKIRKLNCELLIHPTYSRCSVSDELVFKSGIKNCIGYDGDMTNLTLPQKVKYDKIYSQLIPATTKYLFEFYRNLDFFENLLSKKIHINSPSIKFVSIEESTVLICPGAKDSFRRWSPENFIELCEQLKIEYHFKSFIICGSDLDKDISLKIIDNSKLEFINLTGKLNLLELLEAMSKANLIITNDSGPFHIAVALNKKTVCISNGNNYGRFTPYPKAMNKKSFVVYPKELSNLKTENERLNIYAKHGSKLDINTIQVSEVMNAIKNNLMQSQA